MSEEYPDKVSEEDWEEITLALTYLCQNDGVDVEPGSMWNCLKLHGHMVIDPERRETFVKEQSLSRLNIAQAAFLAENGIASPNLQTKIDALELELGV